LKNFNEKTVDRRLPYPYPFLPYTYSYPSNLVEEVVGGEEVYGVRGRGKSTMK